MKKEFPGLDPRSTQIPLFIYLSLIIHPSIPWAITYPLSDFFFCWSSFFSCDQRIPMDTLGKYVNLETCRAKCGERFAKSLLFITSCNASWVPMGITLPSGVGKPGEGALGLCHPGARWFVYICLLPWVGPHQSGRLRSEDRVPGSSELCPSLQKSYVSVSHRGSARSLQITEGQSEIITLHTEKLTLLIILFKDLLESS
jgi:hypothetical protein